MKAWLMDTYRKKNSIILWVKTPEKDIRIEKLYISYIYLDSSAMKFLKNHDIDFKEVIRQTYLRQKKKVLQVQIPDLQQYEKSVRWIEKKTRYRLPMYNADIAPEQMFLYENDLVPFCLLNLETLKSIDHEESVVLDKAWIKVVPSKDIYKEPDSPVKTIIINDTVLEGEEKDILSRFTQIFIKLDPDAILLEYAFSRLPYLASRLEANNIECPLHRWDSTPIRYKGGKSFYSYGNVYYRDFGIRLHGRFLIDTTSVMSDEVELESIMELAQLSGARLQQLASRSFGAVFQFALIRELVRSNYLVPYKEKPVDRPLSLMELLKSDRVGHTLDPKTGFHKDVAAIDFCSMYPWIIYIHNISADTLLCDEPPFEHAPGIPVRISRKFQGIVPRAIKPFLDKRMYYKKNPSSINKIKSAGLKWVLVTSYGYLRYREFKLGIPSSHMAIGAFARDIMIKAYHLAEEFGFEVVHGIIDSLYIKKKNITDEEVDKFCRELEVLTGIPITKEGIFRWVVFLPSILDSDRPVPTKYYGVYKSGDLKIRGIEVRQKNVPKVVKTFQQNVIERLSECDSKREIVSVVPELCSGLKKVLENINILTPEWLCSRIKLSKTEYKHNIPQKKITYQLKKKGITVHPGQTIKFIYQRNKIVLPEDYNGKPDIEQYKKLLVRSLYIVLQPFGITKQYILELVGIERQTRLNEYTYGVIPHYFIPIKREYKSRKGLSERLIKRRLEKQGWEVWRGGLLNILKEQEIYPNVKRKYEKLMDLMEEYQKDKLPHMQYISTVHHGMPDFLCFRKGEFKFVECKLGHEQLSKRQKKTITKLQQLGFRVEVFKLSEACTKTIRSTLNVNNGTKRVFAKQLTIST
jgi:DNA polymerase elongation subunit (family B)